MPTHNFAALGDMSALLSTQSVQQKTRKLQGNIIAKCAIVQLLFIVFKRNVLFWKGSSISSRNDCRLCFKTVKLQYQEPVMDRILPHYSSLYLNC